VSNGHHNHSFASVRPYAARVMPHDAPAFHPFPLTTVKVHVGSADATRFEFYENFFACNLRLWNILNLNVTWTFVNRGFQKQSPCFNFNITVHY
jgi:hypothetical protein